jgi:hypothetical protein
MTQQILLRIAIWLLRFKGFFGWVGHDEMGLLNLDGLPITTLIFLASPIQSTPPHLSLQEKSKLMKSFNFHQMNDM